MSISPVLRTVETVETAHLHREGYEVHIDMDGPGGLKAARVHKPELIVLDIMLPGMDGIEVLGHLRRESDVYVIMLTAKSEETDKIVGLSVGADGEQIQAASDGPEQGSTSTLLTIGVLVGLVFLGIWLWRRFGASEAVSSWAQPQASRQPAASEILQRRYARGELTREEYQRMLQDVA